MDEDTGALVGVASGARDALDEDAGAVVGAGDPRVKEVECKG